MYFKFGATHGSDQGLLLALCSEINPVKAWDTIWDASYQVSCMQSKCPAHCAITLAHICIYNVICMCCGEIGLLLYLGYCKP